MEKRLHKVNMMPSASEIQRNYGILLLFILIIPPAIARVTNGLGSFRNKLLCQLNSTLVISMDNTDKQIYH